MCGCGGGGMRGVMGVWVWVSVRDVWVCTGVGEKCVDVDIWGCGCRLVDV